MLITGNGYNLCQYFQFPANNQQHVTSFIKAIQAACKNYIEEHNITEKVDRQWGNIIEQIKKTHYDPTDVIPICKPNNKSMTSIHIDAKIDCLAELSITRISQNEFCAKPKAKIMKTPMTGSLPSKNQISQDLIQIEQISNQILKNLTNDKSYGNLIGYWKRIHEEIQTYAQKFREIPSEETIVVTAATDIIGVLTVKNYTSDFEDVYDAAIEEWNEHPETPIETCFEHQNENHSFDITFLPFDERSALVF